jgi:hypothetical protein
MLTASLVFAVIILNNKRLLTFFDVLPICYEVDIVNGISPEDKLRWRGTIGGMNRCAHAEGYR